MPYLPRPAILAAIFASVSQAGWTAEPDFYPKRDWGGLNGGDMNTSSFVFRDMNRNGVYDIGDRPMPFVAVVMTRPDGETVMRRTNLSGFGNFKMSVRDRSLDVVNPGPHSFRVVPPPGWLVSTGNETQTGEYQILPGAPGDMVALAPTHPVGLVASLSISGTARAGAKVRAAGPDGIMREAEAGADGRFSLDATPGPWTVTMPAVDGHEMTRTVTLGATPVLLSSAGHDVGRTDLSVVDFDHLMMSEAVLEIPSGHGGLNWFNLIAMHQRFTDGPGYVNGTTSGEFIAYNSSGHPARVWSDISFDFVGADFGAGWDNAEGETLSIRAFRGDILAYEDTVPLSAMGAVRFEAGYRNITRIDFATRHYWQMTMDDFTYRLGQSAQ